MRERGIGECWNEACDETFSENTCSHFGKEGGFGRCAQKILEPILQEMMVKEQERREAHLHEITIAAIRDKQ